MMADASLTAAQKPISVVPADIVEASGIALGKVSDASNDCAHFRKLPCLVISPESLVLPIAKCRVSDRVIDRRPRLPLDRTKMERWPRHRTSSLLGRLHALVVEAMKVVHPGLVCEAGVAKHQL